MSTKLSKRPANLRSGLPQLGRRLMVGLEDETERGEEKEDMEEEEERWGQNSAKKRRT